MTGLQAQCAAVVGLGVERIGPQGGLDGLLAHGRDDSVAVDALVEEHDIRLIHVPAPFRFLRDGDGGMVAQKPAVYGGTGTLLGYEAVEVPHLGDADRSQHIAQSVVGFKPTTGLAEGLAETIDWYRTAPPPQ